MQAIAEITLAGVAPDFGVAHELEVDAVALPGDVIFLDNGSRAFPEVDAVAAVLFFFQNAPDVVAAHPPTFRIGQVNGEIAVE